MRALPANRSPAAALARLRTRLGCFALATGGLAALEFAMVLPVMLMMYLGMTEVTIGVNTDRKLTMLARTLADLTGRASVIDNAEMDNIFGAASSVMAPYNGSNVSMVVSSIVVRETGKDTFEGRVCWSDMKNAGSARAVNEVVPVPLGYRSDKSSYILVETKMPYKPMIGHAITGEITLSETTPWPVRNQSEVERVGRPKCL